MLIQNSAEKRIIIKIRELKKKEHGRLNVIVQNGKILDAESTDRERLDDSE